jgi:SAM-dependent methyltransferase
MSPSPFVVEWVRRVAAERSDRRALDLAIGRGRHAAAIANAGFRTFGVDRNLDALRTAVADAAAQHVALGVWCADLEHFPLPPGRFDLVVVARYLQRGLFASIERTLAPRGVLIYETFTSEQRRHATGPTSPDHLLEPGELARAFGGLDVLFYEEVLEPEAVARFVGRRPASRS